MGKFAGVSLDHALPPTKRALLANDVRSFEKYDGGFGDIRLAVLDEIRKFLSL